MSDEKIKENSGNVDHTYHAEPKSYENNNTGDEEESNDRINNPRNGKPVDNLEKMNFNSGTETYSSEGPETKTSIKLEVRDYEMVTFEKKKLNLYKR